MKIWAYVARRTFLVIFSLFGLSVLVFVLSRVLPGDPALMLAGPDAPKWVVDQLRIQLRLDQPLYTQYFYWLNDVFHGNLGYSTLTRQSVTLDIIQHLPASLALIGLAAVFSVIGAFALGVVAGRYSYKWPDNIVRLVSYVGISIPAFVLAIIFQLVFGMWLQWFPVSGPGTNPVDELYHLVLPAAALCMGGMLQDARIIRAGMVENKDKDYVSMETAQGLPERTITFKYLLKPSVIPAVTVMGLDIAALLANAFLVETVFNWPGFSQLGIRYMLNKDLNGIIALVLIIGLIYAIANIVVDVVVAYLDPRIRLMERGE
jgi:peptide/nickel transport system permease protein